MMPIFDMTVKLKGIKVGVYRDASAKAYAEVARYWHINMFPKHFTRAGSLEYGYTKRTAAYMKRKARVKHHQDPLVWSGELKRRATFSREVIGKPDMGQIKFKGLPRYTYQFHKSTPVHKAEEMVKTSKAEERVLEEVYKKVFFKELNKNKKFRDLSAVKRGG